MQTDVHERIGSGKQAPSPFGFELHMLRFGDVSVVLNVVGHERDDCQRTWPMVEDNRYPLWPQCCCCSCSSAVSMASQLRGARLET